MGNETIEKDGDGLKHIPATYRGICFLLLSSLSFACMAACVRLAGDLPTIQKSFFRNAVALTIALAVLIREKRGFLPAHKENWLLLLGRSFFGTVGLLANFYAVDRLLLPDATMLNKMSPFFAVIASYFILKEKITPTQGFTLLFAFAGALFIIKPTPSNMDLVPSLVGLAGGLCAGTAYTLVRKLSLRGERGPIIVFAFSAFSCLVALPFLILDYHPMTPGQLGMLLLGGLFAAGGQFSITAAYSAAPAREISVYDYAQVIFSALLGFILFHETPDLLSVVGYVVICSAAYINFRYHHKKDSPSA